MLGDAQNPRVATPATVATSSDLRMIFPLAMGNTPSHFFA
jgi:hypothetical protein